MTIGVFDSGIGGLSVAQAIQKAFPGVQTLYVNDSENVPYGTKTPDIIFNLAVKKIRILYESGCNPIVLACNTVTMTIKPCLQETFPDVTFIGLDPMIKPAALATKTGAIVVCATPATLRSDKYKELKSIYAKDIHVIEPDCSDWASLIEKNEMTEERIRQAIEPGLRQGADVVVLACTHYHWIEDEIRTLVKGAALILQPESAVIKRLQTYIG